MFYQTFFFWLVREINNSCTNRCRAPCLCLCQAAAFCGRLGSGNADGNADIKQHMRRLPCDQALCRAGTQVFREQSCKTVLREQPGKTGCIGSKPHASRCLRFLLDHICLRKRVSFRSCGRQQYARHVFAVGNPTKSVRVLVTLTEKLGAADLWDLERGRSSSLNMPFCFFETSKRRNLEFALATLTEHQSR